MKKLVLTFVALVAITVSSFAQQWVIFQPSSSYVSGYTRGDGTYVSGYYRSTANSTNWDNFSTVGNYNPYTGSVGHVARDYSVDAYNYGCGQTIYSGPRGGQYYYNSNGNRTYVPKRWLW